METKNEKTTSPFPAVEFMREVRQELTELFLKDKKKYMEYLKHSMEEFKARQKKIAK
jgi:hypothetical protein